MTGVKELLEGGMRSSLVKDEQMSLVRRFQTPIAVNGRIFVAADNRLYAFVPSKIYREDAVATRRSHSPANLAGQ